MKIKKINLFSYSLPFKRPIVFNDKKLAEREGLLIRLTDTDDNIGWGEIAPLPGFSKETISEAIAQLKTISPELKKIKPGELEAREFTKPRSFEILPEIDLHPSVRFGLELATFELTAERKAEAATIRVLVNSLITSLDSSAPDQIADLVSRGCRSFKIKVGRTDSDDEIKQLKQIAKILPTDCLLRLDANRAWTFEEAVSFCQKIVGLPLEYLEEPLTDPKRLGELADRQPIPLALDETLLETSGASLNSLLGRPGIAALVLKPTLLGGIKKTLELARLGQSHGLLSVISSSFESEVGINCLTMIAHTVDPDRAHGLDTLGAFASELSANGPLVEGGFVTADRQTSLSINLSRLTEVTLD